MSDKEFYCSLYEGDISQYDCDELQCGANTGYIPNDGLPPLLPIEVIRAKRQICINCKRNSSSGIDIVTQTVDGIAKRPEDDKPFSEKKRMEE